MLIYIFVDIKRMWYVIIEVIWVFIRFNVCVVVVCLVNCRRIGVVYVKVEVLVVRILIMLRIVFSK